MKSMNKRAIRRQKKAYRQLLDQEKRPKFHSAGNVGGIEYTIEEIEPEMTMDQILKEKRRSENS